MDTQAVREAVEQQKGETLSQNEAMLRVARWDRAMQRAFKGIVSRPKRHASMVRASERLNG